MPLLRLDSHLDVMSYEYTEVGEDLLAPEFSLSVDDDGQALWCSDNPDSTEEDLVKQTHEHIKLLQSEIDLLNRFLAAAGRPLE